MSDARRPFLGETSIGVMLPPLPHVYLLCDGLFTHHQRCRDNHHGPPYNRWQESADETISGVPLCQRVRPPAKDLEGRIGTGHRRVGQAPVDGARSGTFIHSLREKTCTRMQGLLNFSACSRRCRRLFGRRQRCRDADRLSPHLNILINHLQDIQLGF